jgi:prepilin-type N-terminal cleavage/methylation domain-containing protein
MENSAHTLPRNAGFSLIELMVVVSIIAVLSTVAIPLFQSYQLRTRTAEVKTNLTAIRTAEESYYAEWGSYLAADPEPAVVPGSTPVDFNDKTTAFGTLGFKPEGRVFFSYGAALSADGTGYTIDAAADIDQDGIVQFWGYSKPDKENAKAEGSVGCDVSLISSLQINPCGSGFGVIVF